ncbi:MAG: radical SAM protein [Bryobacteraceae bacterium]|nr:radical SAM protein [Bryobacteraceae bacterium]
MLRGIAKFAANAPVLEAKARVDYFELAARSLLNRCANANMPFSWTINPYRGCEFACRYCYARATHEFLELHDPKDFETKIYAKSFHAPAFARELAKVGARESIALGTATDPYQPAERRYGLTRRILEVFARRTGYQLSITTKGDLITRDIDLLDEIRQRNAVSVNMTVTTLDAALARALEPMAPRPDLRIAAVARLAARGLHTSVFVSPLMPRINDGRAAVEAIARAARDAGAQRFGGRVLYLDPVPRATFFRYLREERPELLRFYQDQFAFRTGLRPEETERLKGLVDEVRARFQFPAGAVLPVEPPPQLALFA